MKKRIDTTSTSEAGEVMDGTQIHEMDQAHRERVCRLLFETGRSPGVATQDTFIAAYKAILLKDMLWTMNELLIYRMNEVHR